MGTFRNHLNPLPLSSTPVYPLSPRRPDAAADLHQLRRPGHRWSRPGVAVRRRGDHPRAAARRPPVAGGARGPDGAGAHGADRTGLLSEVVDMLADVVCIVMEACAWTHRGRLACVAFLRSEDADAGRPPRPAPPADGASRRRARPPAPLRRPLALPIAARGRLCLSAGRRRVPRGRAAPLRVARTPTVLPLLPRVLAVVPGAVVPWQRWWLKVLGEQGDRAAADPAVLPRLANDVAGARDLVPQLVQLAQQLHGVLLQRGPVRTAPRVAALRALLRSNPPPVLQLLQIGSAGRPRPTTGGRCRNRHAQPVAGAARS